MGRRSLSVVLVMASVALSAGALAVVLQVPPSAYVVPHVRIAAADEPIRISPQMLGAARTDAGLVWDEGRMQRTLEDLRARFEVAPKPGRYELTDGGVVMHEGVPGAELDLEAARHTILEALKGTPDLELPVRSVPAPQAPPYAIVVRLSEFRLELFEGGRMVQHYVVGVGALDFPTPPGAYYVRSKAKNPTWRNPGSGWSRSMPRFIPPGPRNPLGTRALRLDRGALVIHGTPNPSSVGRRSSHGCIRMHRADVEALFEIVPTETPVFIVP